jgi:hypothetical protein
MFGADDEAAFLADMGVPCSAGAVAFVALFDQADALVDLSRAAVHTRQYTLTYRSSAVTLTRGQAVTVNGAAYTVREAPQQLDDGAFTRAVVTKS